MLSINQIVILDNLSPRLLIKLFLVTPCTVCLNMLADKFKKHPKWDEYNDRHMSWLFGCRTDCRKMGSRLCTSKNHWFGGSSGFTLGSSHFLFPVSMVFLSLNIFSNSSKRLASSHSKLATKASCAINIHVLLNLAFSKRPCSSKIAKTSLLIL